MLIARKIYIFALLCFLFSFFQKNEANGQQNIGMEKFSFQILNDTIAVKLGQFAFNSITINNTSQQNLTLGLRFILPVGWNFVTPPNASFELKAGEFQSIPFRISPSKSALGDINYPITVIIKNPISGKEVIENFFVKIKQNTSWQAKLLNSNLVIEEKDSLSKFQLKIKNNGNKRELFEISFKSDLNLSLPSSGTQIMLWPGRDSTLVVYVASRRQKSNSNSVSFFVKAKNETIMVTGNVFFPSEVYQENNSKFGSIPVEFQIFSVNSFGKKSGYTFFDMSGIYNFTNQKTLSFRFRSNSFNPDYTIDSHYYSLIYKSDRFNLDLGSQNMFLNYQIIGLGARIGYFTKKKKEYEIFGLESQFSNAQVYGFRQENNKVENRVLKSDALILNDKDKNLFSLFALHNLEKKISTSKLFSLSAGYSSEKVDSLKSFNFGFMGGYRFESKVNKIHIQSTYQYYSDKFPGMLKGVKYGSHDLRLGSNFKSISLFSESNSRQPVLGDSINIGLGRRYNSQEHGLKIGISNLINRSTLIFSYLEQYQQNNFLNKMNGYKSSINFSFIRPKLSQSLMVNYMKTGIKGLDNNLPKNSYSFFYHFKFKDLGVNANYTIGPNFYNDYLSFITENIRPKSHNLSLYYELKNKSRTFYDRINITSNYNSFYSKNTVVFRNEIYFEMQKAKSSVNIYTNLNVLEPTQGSSLNISLKKTIDLPVFIKPKYFSASIFLFKDKNNNDLFDKGEEAISDVNLMINGHSLKTNKKGMIFLKNVEKDEYIVDYRKIQNLKGWIVKEGSVDTLLLDRNISIGVPFKQSRMVAGKVKYELENSTKEVKDNLSGILIIAINKKGEMFRTATNERGEFYLNLNEDTYNIQIPTNIFGEGYIVEKSILSVDLTKESYSEIEFKVIQRRRQMNIKKQ